MNPTVDFRDQLNGISTWISEQFDHVLSSIKGSWLVEHTDQDGHGDITAHSLTLYKDEAAGWTGDIEGQGEVSMTGPGKSQFGGNVRVARVLNSQVEIGASLGTAAGNDGTVGPGIDINPNQNNSAPNIRWVTALGTFRELRTLWSFGATIADCPLMIRDDTTLGGYAVMPGKGTTPFKAVYLGSNTDGGSAGYWNAVFGRQFFRPEYASAQGEWTDVAFAAGNFTGNGGAWTVGAGAQLTYTYSVVGKQLTVGWLIAGTAVGAGVTFLNIAIPNGYVAAKDMRGCHFAQDNAAAQVAALCRVVAGGTNIILYSTAAAGAWTNTGGANNTSVQGTFTFAIQ